VMGYVLVGNAREMARLLFVVVVLHECIGLEDGLTSD
jgi:hypothetical protein